MRRSSLNPWKKGCVLLVVAGLGGPGSSVTFPFPGGSPEAKGGTRLRGPWASPARPVSTAAQRRWAVGGLRPRSGRPQERNGGEFGGWLGESRGERSRARNCLKPRQPRPRPQAETPPKAEASLPSRGPAQDRAPSNEAILC